MYQEDTIAAISTSPGEGGIGIIRISGKDSLNIINKIFVSYRKKDSLDFKSFTIRYGHIVEPFNKKEIDEVLVSYMKAPNTYTKEDIIEINCHGGSVPVKRVLEVVLRNGARLAEPGEFTKRAFLNGRLDLSQAEAVIDMIRSKTDKGMEAAFNQLEGKLSKKLNTIKYELTDIMSHIEASIDFPEDDIDDVLYDKLKNDCINISWEIDELIKTSETGKILREGLNVMIAGKPNVGKSSLLNALIDENRAIVTDIPGTTRDIIEEYISIKGIPIKLIDTAGIRDTNDKVEKIGVEKTKEYFKKADLILFLLDWSNEITKEDKDIFDLIKNKNSIIIINKTDLPQKIDINKVRSLYESNRVIEISVINDVGIELLKEKIYNNVFNGEVKINNDIIITNMRHKELLLNSKKSLEYAIDTLGQKIPLDLISIDIRNSLEYIGQITGESVQDNIIERIFSKFCIGK